MSPILDSPPVTRRREPWHTVPPSPNIRASRSRGSDYVPFANVETRNGLQARVEIPLMLHALRLPVGGRILEIGCGRGVALPLLAARLAPVELIGVDLDDGLLEAAERRVRSAGVDATLLHADARDLPISSASVDLVIDFGTCYHVSDDFLERADALAEVARVLRPGGLFVHETRIAQRLAHPLRSFGRRLPWSAIPELVWDRGALLWEGRRRTGPA